MAAVKPIAVGDEVECRTLPGKPVGYVTLNTEEHFCVMIKTGYTYNTTREAAKPNKTGRRADVAGFLKMLQAYD